MRPYKLVGSQGFQVKVALHPSLLYLPPLSYEEVEWGVILVATTRIVLRSLELRHIFVCAVKQRALSAADTAKRSRSSVVNSWFYTCNVPGGSSIAIIW